MPRKGRYLLNGKLCHYIVQGINKEYIFEEKDDKNKYLSLLKNYYKKYKIDIICYCIMDNHTHLILYSDNINNISEFMRIVNSLYAMYYNKKLNRVGYVFRDRYKSVLILDRSQLLRCIKYIHMNPVKANIVKRESEYEYSSYNDYINNSGFLNQRILDFLFFKSQDYIEKFKEIPYQNIYDKKIFLKEKLEEFLLEENKEITKIKYDKNIILKFMEYLKVKGYKYTIIELADVLDIKRSTLYRKIGGIRKINGKF